MSIIKLEALRAKYPGVEFMLTTMPDGVVELVWGSEGVPKPTEEEIDQIVAEFRVTAPPEDELGKRYDEIRSIRYPSIEEQLDILYHKGYDGWKEVIDGVKNRYPKPPLPALTPRPGTRIMPITEV